MAIKKSMRTNKHRPTSLGRSVSFEEEKHGSTRISRPGTSPSSPPHKRYPITSPYAKRWCQRTLTPDRPASVERPDTPYCEDDSKFSDTSSSISDIWSSDEGTDYGDDELASLTLLHNLDPALIVTIIRRENGDIEFQDGESWHKLESKVVKRVTRQSAASKSSPTAGSQTLPALLQNGNLTSASKHEDFQFRDTTGWICAAKETTAEREHIERWIYIGETPSKQQKLQQQHSDPETWSNNDLLVHKTTGDVTFRTLASFRKISESSSGSGAALFVQCGDEGSLLPLDVAVSVRECNDEGFNPLLAAAIPRLGQPKSNTAKARKNRKAREKKVLGKRNVGKRVKVPYIPQHVFEGKRLTRSRAKAHHVCAKEFYALP